MRKKVIGAGSQFYRVRDCTRYYGKGGCLEENGNQQLNNVEASPWRKVVGVGSFRVKGETWLLLEKGSHPN